MKSMSEEEKCSLVSLELFKKLLQIVLKIKVAVEFSKCTVGVQPANKHRGSAWSTLQT